MKSEIYFNGKKYLSANVAARRVKLSRDYVARLCRKGNVLARREGKGWYVDESALQAFIVAQRYAQNFHKRNLAEVRTREYHNRTTIESSKPSMLETHSASAPDNEIDLVQLARKKWVRENLASTLDKLDTAKRAQMQIRVPTRPARAVQHHVRMERFQSTTAFVATLVIVFGIYTSFNPSYTRDALGMFDDTAAGLFAAAATAMPDTTNPGVRRANADVASNTGALNRVSPTGATSSQGSSSGSSAIAQRADLAAAATASDTGLAGIIVNVGRDGGASAANVASAANATGAAGANALPSPAAIATAVILKANSVAYGDVVAYDPATDTYTLTSGANDPNAYGVVVEQPALLFKPSGGGTVPVAQSGTALVNVTLENGAIHAGDALTSSSIPGKAMRANSGDRIVAFAAEDFSGAGGVELRMPNGATVLSGTISASIGVAGGPNETQTSNTQCTSFSCKLLSAFNENALRTFGRYLLAGLIAVLSITFAFRSYMSDANYGVISMGRNPRARVSIQSIVVFNAILAMVIATVGLFASMIVLFAAT